MRRIISVIWIFALCVLLLCLFPALCSAENAEADSGETRSAAEAIEEDAEPDAAASGTPTVLTQPYAAETVLLDCSGDQRGYGAQVAQLNALAGGQAEPQLRGDSVQASSLPRSNSARATLRRLSAVLCRTDGSSVDFSFVAPSFVVAGPHDCYTLFFDSEEAAAYAAGLLGGMEGLLYAELDGEVTASAAEDFSFHSWGARDMNYGAYLDFSSQWRGEGSALVAIVDSGVSLHPLYEDRLLESGYDYVDGDEDSTSDATGHGTNVAGIVADCSQGAPVYLYPIRVLSASNGGKISNVVNAIREATDRGVTVINLSLESSNLSESMDSAINDAVGAGISVVAAAGNHTMDTAEISPAHITTPGVLIVGAANAQGERTSYSNYGTSVDLYAYGASIVCCSRSGGYTSASGTSVAAPHISALAALLKLLHAELTPAELEYRIVQSLDLSGAVAIPNLCQIIPARLGFRLVTLRMLPEESFSLPAMATPETAQEEISYSVSDGTLLSLSGGVLTPLGLGSAQVTASCTGFDPVCFTVVVEEDGGDCLLLPSGTQSVEDEAFFGDESLSIVEFPEGTESLGARVLDECDALRLVLLPASLTEIGENDFSGAVVICPAGSAAEDYVFENGLAYLAVE